MQQRAPLLIWTLIVTSLLSWISCSRAAEDDTQPAALVQDTIGLLANMQQVPEGSHKMRELANLYELLQLAAIQQQQRGGGGGVESRLYEQLQNDEAPGGGGDVVGSEIQGPALPLPLSLQARLIAAIQGKEEALAKDKRGSYMSLCHFKICNMGRKRGSYWNGWTRE